MIGGLVYNFLPFALLPIYVSLEKIPTNLFDAASDLYSPFASTFRRVILPMSLPGVFAGTLLVFIPASGDFINQHLLGDVNKPVIGGVIQARFLQAGDYPDRGGHQPRADADHHRDGAHLRPHPRHGRPRMRARPKLGTVALWIISIAVFVYLFIPLVTIAVFTFNEPTTKFNTTWEGFTFDNWLHPFSEAAVHRRPDREREGGDRRLRAGHDPRAA